MRFRTLVVDPPWCYRQALAEDGASAHYDTLTMADMLALPVGEIAEPDAHLYLWTTNAFMVEAHLLMVAWGFEQKTILTWIKTGCMGMGFYYRNMTEHVLFGVRGRLPVEPRNLINHFTAPKRRHSAKPPAFFDLVESASPGPYVEVFGRHMARLGWTALGNEVGTGGDIRDSLRALVAGVRA